MVEINKNVKKLIEKNAVAFATVDKSNKPNVIGTACLKVVSADEILITDNYMKQTKENIQDNNNVCLAVWDKDWKGYKILGKANYFSTGKWKKYVEVMKENKGLPAKGAIIVKVSKIIKLG